MQDASFSVRWFAATKIWVPFVSLAAILLSTACGSAKKPVTSSPPSTLPPLQESVINIPVKLYAPPYLKQAESMAPVEFTSDKWPNYLETSCDFRYKYRFVRSGLSFACVNNRMTITFAGNYQIAGSKRVCAFGQQVSPWINGSCGFGNEPMRRVQVTINSQLQFQPNYTLRTTTLPEKVLPIDKCTVTIFNSDVTQEVVDSIGSSVAAFGSYMDNTIAGIRFTSTLQTLAATVGKKIPLMNFGYLKVNPSAVKAGMLNFRQDTLFFTLGVACFPEISSDSNNISITRFLPPLQTGELKPGFVINSNAAYAYAYIDSLITRFIGDKNFNLEGHDVIIRSVRVNGLGNNRVEFRIDFDGSKKGTLYLNGTPSLDVDKQVISVPDLEYSLKSKDLLLNVGKTLFNKKILKMMREKAVLNINEVYRENKPKLDSALNRTINPQVMSVGNTESFRVTGLVINQENLLFQLRLSGGVSFLLK